MRLRALLPANGEPEDSRHAALSPYLFDAGGLPDPHLVVREESTPINGMGRLIVGSKPIDGGHYMFDTAVSERVRVEHLFMLYEKMRAPLQAALKSKRRTLRRRIRG